MPLNNIFFIQGTNFSGSQPIVFTAKCVDWFITRCTISGRGRRRPQRDGVNEAHRQQLSDQHVGGLLRDVAHEHGGGGAAAAARVLCLAGPQGQQSVLLGRRRLLHHGHGGGQQHLQSGRPHYLYKHTFTFMFITGGHMLRSQQHGIVPWGFERTHSELCV